MSCYRKWFGSTSGARQMSWVYLRILVMPPIIPLMVFLTLAEKLDQAWREYKLNH